MDWNVKAGNHAGIAFYESLGAVLVAVLALDMLLVRHIRPLKRAIS